MKLIHAANELKLGRRKVCLAVGFFDGVHLGHQQIIRQTIADARQRDALALVLTFDRHPDAIIAPGRVPPLIYSLPQKLHAIESLGADSLLLVHFDGKFSRQTGVEFIHSLARDLGQIQSFCIGADFVFGHKRSGNVALLEKLGGELGFFVHGIKAVSLDGQIVSSTSIRETIRTGNLDKAGRMLGRPYAISGRVIEGDHVGQQLGFPTANLDAAGLALPPGGVYAGSTSVEDRVYRVALNIGLRPTFTPASHQVRVEAHLLDFKGTLYGRELEIKIGRKLRHETKFASPAELHEQIVRDVSAIRAQN